MKAKHTPGPWFTLREGFSAIYVEARIEGGMLQEVAVCGPTEAGTSQQEANAALIAAAPDLLEALRKYELPIDINNIALSCIEFGSEAVERELQRRAAIAKATGEPQ